MKLTDEELRVLLDAARFSMRSLLREGVRPWEIERLKALEDVAVTLELELERREK